MPGKTASARGEDVDLWYCGKARSHGGNIQAVLAGRFPLWVSDVGPGSVHDITAALYTAAAAGLADAGASPAIHIPAKPCRNRRHLEINTQTRNAPLRSLA